MAFLDIPGPAGRLEALSWEVEAPRAAVVVCHPHPLHGGTMHNHVTYRLAQAFRDAGCSAVRFNFRGVGRSSGSHDEGRGEVDDAAAVLDHLERELPGVPLLAAGFSFGAAVALRLAVRDGRVKKSLAAGLPLNLYDFELVTTLPKPLALVQGDRDEYGAADNVRQLAAARLAPTHLVVVEDCDHLATGRLEELSAAARDAVGWLLEA